MSENYDLYSLGGDKFLQTHGPATCSGDHCVLHNPSEHHMDTWPLFFRADRQFLAERICPHGIGHPDPDSLGYFTRSGMGDWMSVHGCDGCCKPPTENT